MNTLLWAAQAALALVFLAHGLVFTFPPEAIRKIKKQSPLPAGFMGFIYAAESLGALGLILPGLTGLLPWLTPLAAAGLMPIAAGAAVFHLSRREIPPLVVTATLLGLAALVVYGRLYVMPL
jgi:uncharacterized protein YjeT (DUF2065 family)